jgi:hypothetical protein
MRLLICTPTSSTTQAMKSTIIICSVFLGTLLATPSIAQRGQGPVLNKEYMEWKMRKDLGLNDEQIAKVIEMREKHQAQAQADRAALREDMQKRREAMQKEMQGRREAMQAKAEKRQTELKSILTPEQYKKWQDVRFENFEDREQDRRVRQGNRPMRGQMQMRGNGQNRPGNMRGYRNTPKPIQRRG